MDDVHFEIVRGAANGVLWGRVEMELSRIVFERSVPENGDNVDVTSLGSQLVVVVLLEFSAEQRILVF